MAKNRRFADGRQLSVVCTAPAVPASGGPVLFGQRPGVALENERTDGTTSVDFGGVYDLPVTAINDVPANVAVAAGDILYYDATLARLDVGPNGVRFGYAKEAVVAGATTTIEVIVGY